MCKLFEHYTVMQFPKNLKKKINNTRYRNANFFRHFVRLLRIILNIPPL